MAGRSGTIMLCKHTETVHHFLTRMEGQWMPKSGGVPILLTGKANLRYQYFVILPEATCNQISKANASHYLSSCQGQPDRPCNASTAAYKHQTYDACELWFCHILVEVTNDIRGRTYQTQTDKKSHSASTMAPTSACVRRMTTT